MKTSFYSSRCSLLVAGLTLALAGVARGGSFSANFDDGQVPPQGSIYGNASVAASGGVGNSGVLVLTPAATSQEGSFLIDDLDPGSRVTSFTATFNLHMGNGTATPADGICFCFAPDVANSPPFNEEGVDSSSHQIAGIVVTFDAYDNSYDNNAEGPEFRIKYNGAILARRKISNQFQTGTGYVPVTIAYTTAGTLTVVYNNLIMFTNLYVVGAQAAGTRFGFGSRTGGLDQEQFVDNLNITTTTTSDSGFYVKHPVAPYPPTGLSGVNTFQVSLQDSGYVLDTNSLSMTFNGCSVIPTVTKPAGVTTIKYTPPGALLPSSVNHMAVNFSLSGNPTTLLYDFAVTNGPLWSLAPLSRPYLPLDTDGTGKGQTPLYRSLAYSAQAHTNHLYIVSRATALTGLTVNVLDANTGADLYQMNTTGIAGGSIILLNIVAAADGAIYAANMTGTATSPTFNVYRWANEASGTVPTMIYSGDPGVGLAANLRWGDTLDVIGTGMGTQLIADCNNSSTSAVLTPSGSLNTFVATAYSHTYSSSGTTIGRSIQFTSTTSYLLKKRSSSTTIAPPPVMPLELINLGTPPATTLSQSISAYYGEVGPIAVDLTRNLAAGIMFVTNTASADHLVVYDISNFGSPLEIAQYDFPVTHQANANCIGKVVIGTDKIFAVDGNNGIIAVPIAPPTQPVLNLAVSGSSVVLSWTNTVPGFTPYYTPGLAPTTWNPVLQPVVENGNINSVTNSLGSGPLFYRLVK